MERRTGTLKVNEGTIAYTFTPSSSSPPDSSTQSRPALIFLHAAVADRTLWDEQVEYFTRKGWDCLCYDLLGFGESVVSQGVVERYARQKVGVGVGGDAGDGGGEVEIDHLGHLGRAIGVLPHLRRGRKGHGRDDTLGSHLERGGVESGVNKVVLIGLSIGGGLALEFAVNKPDLVAGLCVIAGGIRGFEYENATEEQALFAQEPILMEKGDVEGLAALMIRIWGDGPLQSAGRLASVNAAAAEKMVMWNRDIAAKEIRGTGGMLFGIKEPECYPPLEHLGRLKGVPVAVGWGVYDESSNPVVMKRIAEGVEEAEGREFETAHMVNLEKGVEVNEWLREWLGRHFSKDE